MSGGLVVTVAPGGLGSEAGLRPGDRLLAVNGHRVRDVIDVRFFGADDVADLTVQRGGTLLDLHGRAGEGVGWGVEFAEPLFDGLRTCSNHCPFCFVSGLPSGLRPSLYVHDDDYRLSFLFGSYVTLTNLTGEDWQRLEEQRLSPLYVSVQATDPDLRRRLLGGRPIPGIMPQLERLGRIGIAVEAQVVICPGLNDGLALERTMADLWRLRETVESVALVPVGLTRDHPLRLKPVTADLAVEVLRFADGWQRMARREVGRRFAYPSDELYLLAGRPVPTARAYDGFPQLANGVGMLRRFLDGWRRAERRLRRRGLRPAVASATLVTGRAFLPLLQPVARDLGHALGIACRAEGVDNRLFGDAVTVAGLLSGRDMVEELADCDLGEVVVLPRTMFDAAGARTLDDWTPCDLAAALGRRVEVAQSPSELVAVLTQAAGS
jgi:putative radical SAM enzyme (TIGR03279 family)